MLRKEALMLCGFLLAALMTGVQTAAWSLFGGSEEKPNPSYTSENGSAFPEASNQSPNRLLANKEDLLTHTASRRVEGSVSVAIGDAELSRRLSDCNRGLRSQGDNNPEELPLPRLLSDTKAVGGSADPEGLAVRDNEPPVNSETAAGKEKMDDLTLESATQRSLQEGDTALSVNVPSRRTTKEQGIDAPSRGTVVEAMGDVHPSPSQTTFRAGEHGDGGSPARVLATGHEERKTAGEGGAATQAATRRRMEAQEENAIVQGGSVAAHLRGAAEYTGLRDRGMSGTTENPKRRLSEGLEVKCHQSLGLASGDCSTEQGPRGQHDSREQTRSCCKHQEEAARKLTALRETGSEFGEVAAASASQEMRSAVLAPSATDQDPSRRLDGSGGALELP